MLAHAAFLLLLQTDYLAQGMKALEANQLDTAADLFTKALSAEPQNYAAHFNLALTRTLQSRDAEAIPEYQKTLELKPGLYEADLNLGILLLRAKRPADALPHLDAAAQKKPREFRPVFYDAEALLGTGTPDQAEAAYKRALELNPKSAPAELGLARAQAAANKLPDAEEHFRKAAALDPKYNDALLELAGLEEKAGRSAEAVAIYQQFPDNPAAKERMGELLIENKNFADAIPPLVDAVAKSPTSANRLALATAYRMSAQPQKELEQLNLVVASEPASYDLRMVYGRALRDQHQYVPAANQFYAAAKLKPDSRESWDELAAVLIIHEDYPAGLAALDKAKSLGPETPGHFYLRAISLDKLHQLKPALENYQKFLASSVGKNPDEEFKARQRVRILEKEISRR